MLAYKIYLKADSDLNSLCTHYIYVHMSEQQARPSVLYNLNLKPGLKLWIGQNVF